jgi:hypothetical protein
VVDPGFVPPPPQAIIDAETVRRRRAAQPDEVAEGLSIDDVWHPTNLTESRVRWLMTPDVGGRGIGGRFL